MTVPAFPVVHLWAARPEDGCVGCGRRQTVQLHPYKGRLCPRHAVLPTIPEGRWRRDFCDELVDLGHADAAFAYLRVWMAAEAVRRFRAVGLP